MPPRGSEMSGTSLKMIRDFATVVIWECERIGADTSRFATTESNGDRHFRESGSPGEWRGNLYEALRSLYDLDKSSKEPWSLSAPGYELRETILATINAMKRSDDAAFRRILAYAVGRWKKSVPRTWARGREPTDELDLQEI